MFFNTEKDDENINSKWIFSWINKSTLLLIIYFLIIIKIILIFLWFLVKFGLFGGIFSLLSNINIILIFFVYFKNEHVTKNFIHDTKIKNENFRNYAENITSEFELSLKLIETSLNVLIHKFKSKSKIDKQFS